MTIPCASFENMFGGSHVTLGLRQATNSCKAPLGVYRGDADRARVSEGVACVSFNDLTACLHAGRSSPISFSCRASSCPATPPILHEQPPHDDTPQTRTRKHIVNRSPYDPVAATALLQRGRSKTPRGASRGSSFGTRFGFSSSANMEARRRPEYNLEIFADAACVKDVVKGESPLLSFKMLFLSVGATFPPPPCFCSHRRWPPNHS
jgi:hypothetical protein